MANEAAQEFLNDQITAMRAISQELNRIYLRITDLDEADEFRAGELSSVNQLLFALESARNNLVAASEPIPPPTPSRRAALESALRQLDSYVRSDQDIHKAIGFLTQVASLISNA